MNLYEEACRRIAVLTAQIRDQMAKGHLSKDQGETIIGGYTTILYEMRQAVDDRSGDNDYGSFLRQEFRAEPGSAHCMEQYDPHSDLVRGIVGVGPECRLPEELFALASSQKPD